MALAGLFLALPARAAVDARALALDGVCTGPKSVAVWVIDVFVDAALETIVCQAAEPAAEPAVFGTALRRPGGR